MQHGNFKTLRSKYLTDLVYSYAHPLAHLLYNIKYDGVKNIPKDGFVMLPKHQSAIDGLLEDCLVHQATGKHPYFFAKHTLPAFLEKIGYIRIIRPQDYRKYAKEHSFPRESLREFAGVVNTKAFDMAGDLLNNNQVLVSHVEGEKYPHTLRKLSRGCLEGLAQLQQGTKKPFPFVPLDITYENDGNGYFPRIGSSITLAVKESIVTASVEELLQHLTREIKLVY